MIITTLKIHRRSRFEGDCKTMLITEMSLTALSDKLLKIVLQSGYKEELCSRLNDKILASPFVLENVRRKGG